MIESWIERTRKARGIESTGEALAIDERSQGHITYRLEVQPESWNGKPAVRIAMTTFSRSGWGGRGRKAFSWPATDPKEALLRITRTILNANDPAAIRHDSRSWLGRGFDNLVNCRLINEVPLVAEAHSTGKRHWLHARIMDDNQQGRLVTLTEEFEGRGPLWMRIPIDTVRSLHDRLSSG